MQDIFTQGYFVGFMQYHPVLGLFKLINAALTLGSGALLLPANSAVAIKVERLQSSGYGLISPIDSHLLMSNRSTSLLPQHMEA